MSFLDSLLGGIKAVLSSGTIQPQEPGINFTGAGVSVADDPTNGFTTVTIPGGAVGDRSYVIPQTFGAVGNGSSDDSGAFIAMIAASAGKDILISGGNFRLSNNVTLAATNTIYFGDGALITIDSGKTLTVNGPIFNTPDKQIFAGSGSVIFGPGSQAEVFPDWWGASSTTCLQSVVNAATPNSIPVRLLPKVYSTATTVTIGGTVGGFEMTGVTNHLGSKACILWTGSSGGGPIVKIQDAYRGLLRGITFESNNTAAYGLQFVHVPGVDTFPIEGWVIDNCEFQDAKIYNLLIGRKDADIAADQGDVSLLQFRNCLFVNNDLTTPTVAHVRHRAANGFGSSFIGCQFFGHGANGPNYAVYMQSGDLNFYACVTVDIETFDLFLETGGNTVNVPPSVKIYGWEAQSRNFLKADFSSSAIATQRPTVLSGVIHSDISSPRSGTQSVNWGANAGGYGFLSIRDSHLTYEVHIVNAVDVSVSGLVFDMVFGGGFTGTTTGLKGDWIENVTGKNNCLGSVLMSKATAINFLDNAGTGNITGLATDASDHLSVGDSTHTTQVIVSANSANPVIKITNGGSGYSGFDLTDSVGTVQATMGYFIGAGQTHLSSRATPLYLDINGVPLFGLNAAGNGIEFFNAGVFDLGGGVNVIGIANSSAAPTSNPTTGTIIYSDTGAFATHAADGTVTKWPAAASTTATSFAVGPTPASAGAFRLSKATAINFNDNAGTGNITGLATDASDNLSVGDSTHTAQVRFAANNSGKSCKVTNGGSGYSGFDFTDAGGTNQATIGWNIGAGQTHFDSRATAMFLMRNSVPMVSIDAGGVQFFNSGVFDLASGGNVINIGNASAGPSNPSSGGIIYEESAFGLWHRSPNGVETIVAPFGTEIKQRQRIMDLVGTVQTTDGTTTKQVITVVPSGWPQTNGVIHVHAVLQGRDAGATNIATYELTADFYTNGSSAPTQVGTTINLNAGQVSAALSTSVVTIDVTGGNTIELTVKGVAATTIDWFGNMKLWMYAA